MMLRTTFTLTLILLFGNNAIALPTAKITVKAIDEQGDPIEGAEAGLVLEAPKSSDWGTKTTWVHGVTNGDGLFIGEGETSPYVTLSVDKKGYYGVGGKFTDFTGTTGILGFRKYKPWNPTIELVLKKIINPISMYAVKMSAYEKGKKPEIPILNKFIGFDLVANDWVVPYGLGTHRDFLFKIEVNRANSYQDYDTTMTLRFSNEGDGILIYEPDNSKGKSQLLFPHHAPVAGYINEFIQREENAPGVPTAGHAKKHDNYANYFFRIRTELDDKGNVIGGLYGKIRGQIRLHNFALNRKNHNPFISFNYYLNPNDNDTNIEFDPDKNLFKGVPAGLRVGQP